MRTHLPACWPWLVMGMVVLVAATLSQAQTPSRDPRLGYLFPAGGQQGSTFQIIVGGQFLQGLNQVHVTGEGVTARVVERYRPLRLNQLEKEQREELHRRMAIQVRARWQELEAAGLVQGRIPWSWAARPPAATPATEAAGQPIELPKHPLLNDWENKTLRELLHLRQMVLDQGRKQQNTQLEEMVLLEAAMAPDARPGLRELRLYGRNGMSNAMALVVGTLPEVREIESNDPDVPDPLPAEKPWRLPVVINGQILPGDVDRLRFEAVKGQHLLIQVDARRLIPFLADAVPGWFQPVIRLLDGQGKEVAFADDDQFHPDPVLYFQVPATGMYELEIRDAIHRGREDFVYRIRVGELPRVTSLFPLGGRVGQPVEVALEGWNLPRRQGKLSSSEPGIEPVAQEPWLEGNPMLAMHWDELASQREREPNNTPRQAQSLSLPIIVDGRIDKNGDVDWYEFQGQAGQTLVARTLARRLGSPLDSVLRLTDAQGQVLAWNDDQMEKTGHLHPDMGLQTHHADSYLSVQLPRTGIYQVQVSDAAGVGAGDRAYRLILGPPKPDFELRICPSTVNLMAGRSAVLYVHALRRDGFSGPIHLRLKEAPQGFELDGATIPEGSQQIRLTLSAPPQRLAKPIELKIEGVAEIQGHLVTRPAQPVEDVMQAFLWRHLQPAQTMLVYMTGSNQAQPAPRRTQPQPVMIQPGSIATVTLERQGIPTDRDIKLQLVNPPAGISLGAVHLQGDSPGFDLHADASAKPGTMDNLIIQASTVTTHQSPEGKVRTRTENTGYLRAIPLVITEK